MVVLHDQLQAAALGRLQLLAQLLAHVVFVEVRHRQRRRRHLERIDVVVPQLLRHDRLVGPRRNRHATQVLHRLHQIDAVIHRLAAAVAGQAEALHHALLIGKDELGEHVWRDTDGHLALGQSPQMPRTNLAREIVTRQLVGKADAARADVVTAVVEREETVGFEEIEPLELPLAKALHQRMDAVRFLVEVIEQLLQPAQEGKLVGQTDRPVPGRILRHFEQVAERLLRQREHARAGRVIDDELGLDQILELRVVVEHRVDVIGAAGQIRAVHGDDLVAPRHAPGR